MTNPFSDIHPLPTSQDLVDFAFSKAMKIKPASVRGPKIDRKRNLEINRINTAANVICSRLENIIKQFPSFDFIHPFYIEIMAILAKVDEVKLSLGRIDGTIASMRDVERELVTKLLAEESIEKLIALRKSAFGRLASMTYSLEELLQVLESARTKLYRLPSFDPDLPCVVVAGVPNVGKSSFLRNISSGKPEIAPYPFTTKEIIFGHRKLQFLQVQFVDTPGLLDRQDDERNDIEKMAVSALQYLADILIYIFDPTDTATEPLLRQIELFNNLLDYHLSSEFIFIIGKVDLVKSKHLNQVKDTINDNIPQASVSEILEMSNQVETGYLHIVERIESRLLEMIRTDLKFKVKYKPKIADDQLPLDSLDLEFDEDY